MSALSNVKDRLLRSKVEEYSLEEYLNICKKDKAAYATPAERMLKAIGEPRLVDTQKDPRLSRIFANRTIRVWDSFHDFYGIEETLERIVDYFKHAAQGLEEKKQVLYLLGPVGGSKSTLATRLVKLFEKEPFYAIKGSPIFESPLALFDRAEDGEEIEKTYGIEAHRLIYRPSPWLLKRLEEHEGSLDWVRVVKLYPSQNKQIAIARTEPGDENNQDISALVGKVDIRKLEKYSQNDTDAYSYSGGLCKGNRGILEFVEMFKAPIKVLHPLLTATQEHVYNGTEALPGIPFEGVVVSHSNESEWETFKADKKNEAFIDRVFLVKVPYCLRIDEETQIYKKLIRESSLESAVCAPKTLDLLAKFVVMSRLVKSEGVKHEVKAKVYNGEDIKSQYNNVKTLAQFKNEAGVNEGMSGVSTRFAFKILSKTFNYEPTEVAANPVHLLTVLIQAVQQEQWDKTKQDQLIAYISDTLSQEYFDYLSKEIQRAYLQSYSEYGQNLFDKYVLYAELWLEDQEYRDPSTGALFGRAALEKDLASLEEPAGIRNVSDFRNDVVRYCLKVKSKTGKNPHWTEYEKIRQVIEKKLFANTSDLIEIVSFDKKKTEEDDNKHSEFVKRMVALGYTRKQVSVLVQHYIRSKQRASA